MLAAMLIVASLQTHTAPSVQLSGAVTLSQRVDMSPHKRHELHMAHLAYLHWRHVREEASDKASRTAPRSPVTAHHALSGTLSCSGLSALWESAGGSHAAAFVAAEIAMAESGGSQYATGPAGERGYWQIHPDHGALSTYDPYGNARAAILISDNGSDWLPWTTYTSGAYIGRC